MTNFVRNLVVSIGLLAVLGCSAMLAQNEPMAVARIPFAFHTKDSALAAGKYTVRMHSTPGVIQIQDQATGRSILVRARSRESGPAESPRLTFHRYGNEYFLSQVWMAGGSDGFVLVKSEREKELAKQPGTVATAAIQLNGQ